MRLVPTRDISQNLIVEVDSAPALQVPLMRHIRHTFLSLVLADVQHSNSQGGSSAFVQACQRMHRFCTIQAERGGVQT